MSIILFIACLLTIAIILIKTFHDIGKHNEDLERLKESYKKSEILRDWMLEELTEICQHKEIPWEVKNENRKS